MSAYPTLPVICSTLLLITTIATFWHSNRLLRGISALSLFSCLYFFAAEIATLSGFTSPTDLDNIANAIAGLWWCSLGYLVNHLLDRFIWHGRLSWDGEPAVPRLLREITGLFVYLIVAMIILRIVYNQSITVMAATSGVFAVVLGYSAQSTLREIFAGISLNLDDAFKKGDLIEIDGKWGWIKDMNWRSITYQDMDSNIVVLPNSRVADSCIRNMNRPSKMMRRTIYFHADYQASPASVVGLAEQCLREAPQVAAHPWNFAAFYDYGDIGARYGINFHVASFDDWFVAGDQLANALWYKLSRAGIRFGYNRRLTYTNPEDEIKPVSAQNNRHSAANTPYDLFRRLPLFKPLNDDEIDYLANSANWRLYGAPEKIVCEGEPRNSIFVIDYGRVEVYETPEGGSETRLPDLQPEVPIGILAMLTAGLQQSTIRAAEETGLWEIDSNSLRKIFEDREEAMEQIATTVAGWQSDEDDAFRIRRLNLGDENGLINEQTTSIARRIVNLFVQNRVTKRSDNLYNSGGLDD